MERRSKLVDRIVQRCLDILNDKEVMKLLRETDLIIGEIVIHCPSYLAKYLKKPLIGFHHVPLKYLDHSLGIIHPSQYTLLNEMTFLQKITQYFRVHVVAPVVSFYMMKKFDVIRKTLDINETPIEITRKCPLIIVSYDPVIEYPQPLMPNMFASGIWTNGPAKNCQHI